VSRRSGTGILDPCAGTINTHGDCCIAVTFFVLIAVIVGGDVPVAAHNIVDVVAELPRPGTNASSNAELVIGEESGPFMVLKGISETVTVEKSSNRIALAVSTPVVHLTTRIALGDVDLGEVSNTGDLDVFRGFDKVDTLEGAVGHGARAATRLGAIGDCVTFSVANSVKTGWSEETEI